MFSAVARDFTALRPLLPHLGAAGSKSALLHDRDYIEEGDHHPPTQFDEVHRLRLRIAMVVGATGSLLIALGGLGAGAFPVVGNPLWEFPVLANYGRMLQTSTTMTFVGVGILSIGWLMLSRFALLSTRRAMRPVPLRTIWRTWVLWMIPLLCTAPMFTQDIYSYLAQGAIAGLGWDPYAAGPAELLGNDHIFVRSVPFMWMHSPAPYGPVALGYGAIISWITQDSIFWAILLHRLVGVGGLTLIGWSLTHLARRCHVPPQAALWMGLLNPLVLLHLVAGIHNEAIMLGFLLAGMEFVLRGTEGRAPKISFRSSAREHVHAPTPASWKSWAWIIAGCCLISASGLVKVSAFMALGFAGVAVALWLGGRWRDLFLGAALTAACAVAMSVGMSLITGVGFGWITAQGGAAEIVSWMSMMTVGGLASNVAGVFLGLGDHQVTSLALYRLFGLALGGFWVVRMLWATFQRRMHPIGGLGVAMFFLVIFFPVVHPWYLLWAILPLAAWASHRSMRVAAVGTSLAFSIFVLPRGSGLAPTTVTLIYIASALIFLLIVGIAYLILRRFPALAAATRSETLAAIWSRRPWASRQRG